MLSSIGDAAAALERGRISAVELLGESLCAYERWQPVTNAFIELTADLAAAQARASDLRRRKGDARGPLDGIPIAYKDMFDRRGRRASFGARTGQRARSPSTAPIVARLERAGAVTLGFLNMSEFALGPTGHNAVFGRCRNPWDPERISGGSSSGAGAAVAAGIVLGTIGSDTGGSIRIPAACCGVTGVKTSQGLVAGRGALPVAPSLDCFGPLARSAADCALLLRPLVRLASATSVAAPKLVCPIDDIAAAAVPDVTDAVREALDMLVQSGATVRRARLPDLSELHALADDVQRPECAVSHAERLARQRADYTPHVLARIEAGLETPATAYVRALEMRDRCRRALLADVLGDADALILPTIGVAVPQAEDADLATVPDAPALVRTMTGWTRWLNYLGLPAVSIPCGFDRHGLPIGLQLVGRLREDLRLLAIAGRFQSLTAWHRRRPSVQLPAT